MSRNDFWIHEFKPVDQEADKVIALLAADKAIDETANQRSGVVAFQSFSRELLNLPLQTTTFEIEPWMLFGH